MLIAKLNRRLAPLLFAGCAFLAAPWAHATSHAVLTIKITQGIEGAQPIAIVPFGLQPGSQPPSQDIAQIISDDLTRSGRFLPLPVSDLPSRPSDASAVNFSDFRTLGTPRIVTPHSPQIQSTVNRNWIRPTGAPKGLRCTVKVTQIPGGQVVSVVITKSCGNVAFDRSVENAVLRSSPLPQPKDPSLFAREIIFEFEPED